MTKQTTQHKRSVLLLRLYWLVLVMTCIYALVDRQIGLGVDYYIYVVFFLFAFSNIILIKRGFVLVSKIGGLFLFNLLIFLVASSEPYGTGISMQYFTAGVVALAVFGYEQWKGAIGFVILSLVLHIITLTTDLHYIPWRDFNEEQESVFFLLNTGIASSVSVYTFLLFSKFSLDREISLKKSEQTIQKQNEALVKSNEELDRFVYSASHDLKSPLSSLEGLINLAVVEKQDSERQIYFSMMRERIGSMDSFISKIIDYSRNERTPVQIETIHLKDLLEEEVHDQRYVPGANEVQVNVNVNEDLVIQSDKTRLKILLGNLISNGIKYRDSMKEKNWLQIRCSRSTQDVTIEIEDNGIGINEKLLDNIFEMFYRAHEVSKGSGLGLYIAMESVDRLSGSLTVKSTENIGSLFTVTLPLDQVISD